jgi:hypothetical protein
MSRPALGPSQWLPGTNWPEPETERSGVKNLWSFISTSPNALTGQLYLVSQSYRKQWIDMPAFTVRVTP